MSPTENYCRQFHVLDILSRGKCDYCGKKSIVQEIEREEEEEN